MKSRKSKPKCLICTGETRTLLAFLHANTGFRIEAFWIFFFQLTGLLLFLSATMSVALFRNDRFSAASMVQRLFLREFFPQRVMIQTLQVGC